MKQSLYIYNSGDLKRKDNTLRFTNYEGEKRDVPIERISDIYVMSEMSFNTAFLNYISKYGISIHFFNYYNYYTGSYYPIAICMVLIESDWNLKPFRRILTSTIASVLIKSDWNLKYVARIKSVASAKPY